MTTGASVGWAVGEIEGETVGNSERFAVGFMDAKADGAIEAAGLSVGIELRETRDGNNDIVGAIDGKALGKLD